MNFRFSVDLQADSGRNMSYDMAKIIINTAIGLKNLGQKQCHLVVLGSNNLRKCKEQPQKLLDMFEYLMRRTRNIQGKIHKLSSYKKISVQGPHWESVLMGSKPFWQIKKYLFLVPFSIKI